jgi:hypothetical protein
LARNPLISAVAFAAGRRGPTAARRGPRRAVARSSLFVRGVTMVAEG